VTQPTERRFVMEPRLDAEVETLNTAIEAEETARIAADALKVAKAGDTMTGALVLPGDPSSNLQAAPKQYVDSTVSTEASARIAGDALKVAKAGDTMTGALVLPADPTNNLEAATKQYVDNSVATGTTSGSRTVYVKAGMDLTKGQPVYISGANGTNVIVSAAGNGSEATSSKTIGLINSTVSNNGFAYVTTNGLLAGLDTSAAGAAGDAVWLGPSGTLLYGLANKPYAPAHLVYIGVVTKKNASTGEILINPQNGFELNEIHDVYINPATLVDGNVLKYDEGTELWINGTGGGGGGVTASDTPPVGPGNGSAWYNTVDGTLYVWYVDANSSQWVQVQANSALGASLDTRVSTLETNGAGVIKLNPQTLNSNYTMPSGFNGMSAGPITIADGVVVTIPDGSAWSIV